MWKVYAVSFPITESSSFIGCLFEEFQFLSVKKLINID